MDTDPQVELGINKYQITAKIESPKRQDEDDYFLSALETKTGFVKPAITQIVTEKKHSILVKNNNDKIVIPSSPPTIHSSGSSPGEKKHAAAEPAAAPDIKRDISNEVLISNKQNASISNLLKAPAS